MSAPAVELTDVRLRRGAHFALEVPQLSLTRGERVAIVGRSGAGKTTLLHLIAGILVPDGGRVRVGPVFVSAAPEAARRAFRARHVSMIFQRLALLPYLTLAENVALPGRLGAGGRPDPAAGRALLAAVGLGEAMDRKPATLSQGERQRVAVCRALAHPRPLVLADEPTGSLDAETASAITDLLLQRLDAEQTLLMVTHSAALLPRFDRVVDLEALRP